MTPRVSVIIVTWNGRELLERFLPSVLATDYPDLEVVVADNASSDGTAEWLGAEHPEVVVARHPDNWLFARGNNAALEDATGSLVCFLNNDVEVPPNWLRPLVAALEDDAVAAVQPKLLQVDDRSRFEYAGAAGGFLDALAVPFTRGRIFEALEVDRGQYDDARDVFWATGAAMLVRRDAFEDAGGFDESFGMHQEEIDLCWRLWRAGWRVRVEPASEVYHLGGASLPAGNPRKTYYNVRNSLVMVAKNLPPTHAARIFRGRRVLDGVAWARARAMGNALEADAIRRGRRDAAVMISALEVDLEGSAVVLPSYRGRIVEDAMLRGRRHFSDLPTSRFRPLGL
ncbi:glycosyltransferase family 2 protein [Rubrivirga sp.]|uniref:glycosyltransferase family 2 protein n=1 Tax=Rubrivirga sp. TaxID=1885344 RepID=UPI003C7525FC